MPSTAPTSSSISHRGAETRMICPGLWPGSAAMTSTSKRRRAPAPDSRMRRDRRVGPRPVRLHASYDRRRAACSSRGSRSADTQHHSPSSGPRTLRRPPTPPAAHQPHRRRVCSIERAGSPCRPRTRAREADASVECQLAEQGERTASDVDDEQRAAGGARMRSSPRSLRSWAKAS